jgi:hypothetical protein
MRSLTLGMRITIVAGDTSLMRAMREAICSRKISVGEDVILPLRMCGWDASTKGPSWSQTCWGQGTTRITTSGLSSHATSTNASEGLVVEVVFERVRASSDVNGDGQAAQPVALLELNQLELQRLQGLQCGGLVG